MKTVNSTWNYTKITQKRTSDGTLGIAPMNNHDADIEKCCHKNDRKMQQAISFQKENEKLC